MTDSPKPQTARAREWWIVRDPNSDELAIFAKKPGWKSVPLGHERIHVIEASALDALKANLDECFAESKNEIDQLRKERDDLLEKLEHNRKANHQVHDDLRQAQIELAKAHSEVERLNNVTSSDKGRLVTLSAQLKSAREVFEKIAGYVGDAAQDLAEKWLEENP